MMMMSFLILSIRLLSDSAGVGLVLGRYQQLSKEGRKLSLRRLSNTAYKVFELSGLFEIMEYLKGGANMTNEMSLSFSATLENEPFVRTCIASFVVCLNPTIDEIVEIKTIVGEAVSNAIIHGYNGDKGCLVKVKAYIEDDSLTIYVIDKGQGIQDIEKARQPMFTSKKELEHAGMGLSIIEALCDEMTIESSLELGTQLIMKKRIVHE